MICSTKSALTWLPTASPSLTDVESNFNWVAISADPRSVRFRPLSFPPRVRGVAYKRRFKGHRLIGVASFLHGYLCWSHGCKFNGGLSSHKGMFTCTRCRYVPSMILPQGDNLPDGKLNGRAEFGCRLRFQSENHLRRRCGSPACAADTTICSPSKPSFERDSYMGRHCRSFARIADTFSRKTHSTGSASRIDCSTRRGICQNNCPFFPLNPVCFPARLKSWQGKPATISFVPGFNRVRAVTSPCISAFGIVPSSIRAFKMDTAMSSFSQYMFTFPTLRPAMPANKQAVGREVSAPMSAFRSVGVAIV